MLSEVNNHHWNLNVTYEGKDPGRKINFRDTLLTNDGNSVSSTDT